MDIGHDMNGLSRFQAMQKRLFDLIVSIFGICTVWWLIIIAWVVASIDTRSNGFFIQKRVGMGGKEFRLMKIKTMRPCQYITTTITNSKDPRITISGRFLRNTKIDELPQLFNVLLGEMSFVGPRPDVIGYADTLRGEDRIILSVRPGITGPATLKYREEEKILAEQKDPEGYNRDVIWPDKVRLNREYVKNWNFFRDLLYIWNTIIG